MCAYTHALTLLSLSLHRRMLRSVQAYCETRGLPADLQQRLLSYFEFQQQKAMDSDGSRILRALPDSLRMKVASHQYSYVIQRNSLLFKGCNLQFLNQLMLKLREMYLMPGETLIRAGDMSRELAFVARVCCTTSPLTTAMPSRPFSWHGADATARVRCHRKGCVPLSYCDLTSALPGFHQALTLLAGFVGVSYV